MREDVAWQRDLARQRDQELQALRARESKTAVEIKGLRALATRLGEQMSSEASSAKKDLDYADSLARLRDAELQELRARVGRAVCHSVLVVKVHFLWDLKEALVTYHTAAHDLDHLRHLRHLALKGYALKFWRCGADESPNSD